MKYAMALGLAMLAMAALAGVHGDKRSGAPTATGRTEVEPMNEDFRAASKKPTASNKGPSLRCWQYGRLIFEEPVADVPAAAGGAGPRFEGRSGNLQLVDMHNASCLIK